MFIGKEAIEPTDCVHSCRCWLRILLYVIWKCLKMVMIGTGSDPPEEQALSDAPRHVFDSSSLTTSVEFTTDNRQDCSSRTVAGYQPLKSFEELELWIPSYT